MRIRALVLVGGIALVAFLAYPFIAEIVFDECGIPYEQAKSMVVEQLTLRGLDPKYLTGPINQKGTCFYDFYFEGQGQKLNYVVIEDWPRGPSVQWWDFKREERERPNPTLQGTRQTTVRP